MPRAIKTVGGGDEAEVGSRVSYGVVIGAIGTDLATGTGLFTFKLPHAMDIDDVYASVTVAPTGSGIQVDINDDTVTILSTKLTIDATKFGSDTAAAAAVISGGSPWVAAAYSVITFDVDAIGSIIAGQELTIWIEGIVR